MSDNNSSAFNFRFISHTTKISKHGLGMAVDINTLYNPYVKTVNGKLSIEPANAEAYVDRSGNFPHKIDHNDLCYKLLPDMDLPGVGTGHIRRITSILKKTDGKLWGHIEKKM